MGKICSYVMNRKWNTFFNLQNLKDLAYYYTKYIRMKQLVNSEDVYGNHGGSLFPTGIEFDQEFFSSAAQDLVWPNWKSVSQTWLLCKKVSLCGFRRCYATDRCIKLSFYRWFIFPAVTEAAHIFFLELFILWGRDSTTWQLTSNSMC